MSNPKGMTPFHQHVSTGESVFVYYNRDRIVLQLRHQTPTEVDLLHPSFKVAVELSPVDALLIAYELLAAAIPRLSANDEQLLSSGNEEEPQA
ncbi:MAG: hypothetical protein ACRDHW_16740 [Ktedonobacteraceae bacterium]